jgi:hypothetical protein
LNMFSSFLVSHPHRPSILLLDYDRPYGISISQEATKRISFRQSPWHLKLTPHKLCVNRCQHGRPLTRYSYTLFSPEITSHLPAETYLDFTECGEEEEKAERRGKEGCRRSPSVARSPHATTRCIFAPYSECAFESHQTRYCSEGRSPFFSFPAT